MEAITMQDEIGEDAACVGPLYEENHPGPLVVWGWGSGWMKKKIVLRGRGANDYTEFRQNTMSARICAAVTRLFE